MIYYDIEDGTCLLADNPEMGFTGALLLNAKGKWVDGQAAAVDMARGEGGRVIDESEALALAAKLGGKWPPALP